MPRSSLPSMSMTCGNSACPVRGRMVVKLYPKDDEPRTLRISSGLVETLSRQGAALQLAPEQLLFSSTGRTSGSTSGSTTSGTRMLPGRWPAERTLKRSWTGWGTPRSAPPSATCTASRTRTTTPWPPSPAFATGWPDPTRTGTGSVPVRAFRVGSRSLRAGTRTRSTDRFATDRTPMAERRVAALRGGRGGSTAAP